MNQASYETSKDQLIDDFKVVVADAESLLRATADQGGVELVALRAKAEASLKVAKARMADVQAELLVKTRAAAKATDVYVHNNPWQAIGVAAGVGVVIGLLIGRR